MGAVGGGESGISIHALRGEGDEAANRSSPPLPYFNPRPPWGGRLKRATSYAAHSVFQSTPSVGRATIGAHLLHFISFLFQSTPSVGRATAVPTRLSSIVIMISIHALRGEGDVISFIFRSRIQLFQSTPSVGRATSRARSIFEVPKDFNPRPPWGGRRALKFARRQQSYFNPRPPWGGRR